MGEQMQKSVTQYYCFNGPYYQRSLKMKLKFQISPKSYEKICVRICEKLKKKCYVQDNINKSNKLEEGGRYSNISTNVTWGRKGYNMTSKSVEYYLKGSYCLDLQRILTLIHLVPRMTTMTLNSSARNWSSRTFDGRISISRIKL